jgi:hypothetical protein
MSADGLFDRLRDERDALVATGELVVDLSLDLVVNAGWTPDAARFAFLPMAASGFGAPEPLLELSPISTADLMAPSGRGASVAAHIATGAVVPRYEAVEIEPSLVASAPVVKHDVAPTIASAPGMRSDTPLVAVAAPPTAAAVAEPDDAGLNLSALRKRVKLGPTDAKAVIAELEAVVASGQLNASLARILGEAYLKLGRGDQAAAQFRQAIALRGRRR